jgi:hypothetical protein
MGRMLGSKLIWTFLLGLLLLACIGFAALPMLASTYQNRNAASSTEAVLLDSTATPKEVEVPTNTPEPTATSTPKPAPTNTPEPTATYTPEPTATEVPPTETPEPTATNTPEPTATAVPPTETPVPTEVPTIVPTATDPPTCKTMGADCPNQNTEPAASLPQAPIIPAVDVYWRVLDIETQLPVPDAILRLGWNSEDWMDVRTDVDGRAHISVEQPLNIGIVGGGVSVYHPDYLLAGSAFEYNEAGRSFELHSYTNGNVNLSTIYLQRGPKFALVLDPSPVPYPETFVWSGCGETEECARQLARISFLTDPTQEIECQPYYGTYDSDNLTWFKVGDSLDAHEQGPRDTPVDAYECTQANGTKLWIESLCGNIVQPLPAGWYEGEGYVTFYIGEEVSYKNRVPIGTLFHAIFLFNGRE